MLIIAILFLFDATIILIFSADAIDIASAIFIIAYFR